MRSASAATTAAPNAAAEAATVRVADCRLWQVLSEPARQRLLSAMHKFFAGPVDQGNARGVALAAPRARTLFNNYCRLRFARAFKLYKLYGRAAAFTAPGG